MIYKITKDENDVLQKTPLNATESIWKVYSTKEAAEDDIDNIDDGMIIATLEPEAESRLNIVETESDAGFDWFGKKVYVKAIVSENGGSTSVQTGLDTDTVDQIVKFETVVQGNTQDGSVQGWSPLTPIMSSSSSGTANFYRGWLSNDFTTFTVGIQGGGLGTQDPIYWHVIIYYTKKD